MTKTPNTKADSPESLRRVFKAIKPYFFSREVPRRNARLALVFFLMVLERLLMIASPFLLKYFVDNIAEQENLPPFVFTVPLLLLGGYIVFSLLETLASELHSVVIFPFVQTAERLLTRFAFSHIHRLSLRFHLDRKTGTLSRALQHSMQAISELTDSLFYVVPVFFEAIIVALILGLGFSLWLALCLVILLVVFIGYTYFITKRRNRIRAEAVSADYLAGGRVVDSLLNYETVKYFGNETNESERYSEAVHLYQKAHFKLKLSLAVLNLGQRAFMVLALSVAIGIVMLGIADGTMTLGDIVLVQGLFLNLYRPLFFLGSLYRNITQAAVDLNMLFDLIDEPEEIVDVLDAPNINIAKGKVRFENVSFAYNADRRVLNDVSFDIPAGKMVAVVGSSGAGKSTIARLLFRFYDVTSGRIMIDDQAIDKVTQRSLRAVIGIVPQDTVLFNETIGYNINYGRLDARKDELIQAAKGAQIHDFIMSLPQGYDTLVGERGLKLSGGEKQRVAIARTLLKNPPLLVLDEATSALDSHTEAEIQQALNHAAVGRTTLVIAHRLPTVINADEILVMEAGQIVERGTHASLLKTKGHYAALWQRQQKEQELLEGLQALNEEGIS